MSSRVNAEELESTRSEKFLAVVLTVFLLVGTLWFYVKVYEWSHEATGAYDVRPTSSEAALFEARRETAAEQRAAQRRLGEARNRLELTREAYNTALEDGVGIAGRETAYREAQRRFETRQAEAAEARAAATAARQAAEPAERAHQDRVQDARVRAEWLAAGVRLVFIVLWVLGSYRLIQVLRRRESRYLPVGFAAAATGVILSLVYAVDYILDYIDPLDLGPIVLSVIGVSATLLAFVLLQRYLARRLPARRVRKGECPFCGYPVRADPGRAGGQHCEGCGREVIADCSSCAQPRRVGSAHCMACGEA